MRNLKDGIRAHVRLDWTNRVHKTFRGTGAEERYAAEVAALKTLEERGCPNVPRLLEEHPDELYFVTTSCGKPAPNISKNRALALFEELEKTYGVRHLDAERRNITYDPVSGKFCIIDFELVEILDDPRAGEDTEREEPRTE